MASMGGAGTTWTFVQSASISSARMRGKDVVEPWPISIAGDMIEIVPSGAMLTQGLSDFPSISAAGMAALAIGERASATAKVNPAAPIITCRRDRAICAPMAQPSRAARSMARTIRG